MATARGKARHSFSLPIMDASLISVSRTQPTTCADVTEPLCIPLWELEIGEIRAHVDILASAIAVISGPLSLIQEYHIQTAAMKPYMPGYLFAYK